MQSNTLVLASGSPRRKELLAQLGYDFQVLVTDVEEQRLAGESPEQYVKRLSFDKAKAGLLQSGSQNVVLGSDIASLDSDTVVLGSDTIVVSGDNVLEKPNDLADAKQMLMQLSDSCHQVLTAVTVISNQKHRSVVVSTNVWFKPLSENEIEQYWQTGEPCDKAGSYGIQGLGGRFVTRIEGSYFAVVGLPLFETDQLLREFL